MTTDIDLTSQSTDTVDIVGLNDINATLNLQLPQPLQTESSDSLTVAPLKADLTLEPLKADLTLEPVKAELDTNSHLKIDPLRTDSNLSVDLKPAVVDLCLTVNVGKLPNVCIRQPYHYHLGFTLWGTEIWGYTFSGEQETVVEERHPQPKVALGGAPAWRPAPHEPPGPPTRETGGLRIRLGP